MVKKKEIDCNIIMSNLYRISRGLGKKRNGLFYLENFEFSQYGIYLELENHRLCVLNSLGEWQIDGIILEKSKEALRKVLILQGKYENFINKRIQEIELNDEKKKNNAIDFFIKKFSQI